MIYRETAAIRSSSPRSRWASQMAAPASPSRLSAMKVAGRPMASPTTVATSANQQYYAVDTTDPSAPKLLSTWVPGFANVHGLSIRDDGNRGYFVSLGPLDRA